MITGTIIGTIIGALIVGGIAFAASSAAGESFWWTVSITIAGAVFGAVAVGKTTAMVIATYDEDYVIRSGSVDKTHTGECHQ